VRAKLRLRSGETIVVTPPQTPWMDRSLGSPVDAVGGFNLSLFLQGDQSV